MRITKADREILSKASKVFAKFGRQGAKTTNDKLTPEQRTQAARRAANARWDAVRAAASAESSPEARA